jgi:hypothetical protein
VKRPILLQDIRIGKIHHCSWQDFIDVPLDTLARECGGYALFYGRYRNKRDRLLHNSCHRGGETVPSCDHPHGLTALSDPESSNGRFEIEIANPKQSAASFRLAQTRPRRS